MGLTVKARVGKKRVLVIPKVIAEKTGIVEGTRVRITAEENKIIIEHLRDAVWLSLHGEKIAHLSLKELEEESLERQKEYMEQKT